MIFKETSTNDVFNFKQLAPGNNNLIISAAVSVLQRILAKAPIKLST